MRGRSLLGLPVVLGLALLAALLWLAYGFFATYRVFGVATVTQALHVAASVTTTILAVVAVGHIFMRHAFERMLRAPPTDIQQRLIVVAACFVAMASVLGHFDLGLSTILVFSALLAAITGLSLQPMLVGLVSGLAVDRVLAIGDAFMLNGEAVEVTSLDSTSVVGLRADGTTIVLPNARFAADTMEILPRGRSVRVEVRFDAPMAMPPHRLQRIVSDLVADLAETDLFRPIVVAPVNPGTGLPVQADALTGRYCVSYAVRSFAERRSSEARVLRRVWYALLRERGLPSEMSSHDLLRATAESLRARGDHGTKPEALVEAGEALLFDDGERISLPARLAGRVCLLVDGALGETHSNPAAGGFGHDLTWEASLGRIKDLLSRRIGPYAEYAVDQAAAHAATLTAVCTTVAAEIEDPAERARFLESARRPDERIRMHDPGYGFRTRLSQARRLLSQPPLEAAGHALILAVPEQALRIEPPG